MHKVILIGMLLVALGCAPAEELELPAPSDPPKDADVDNAVNESEEEIQEPPTEPEVPDPFVEPPPEPEADPIPEPEPAPILVNGKTLDERLEDAYDNLHVAGSSEQVLDDFPDLELVFTDEPGPDAKGFFPSMILPFHYYHSEEADKTFNLCGIGRSVFICDGKLDRTLTKEDIDSGRCTITEVYLEDPRLGGSGRMDFDY